MWVISRWTRIAILTEERLEASNLLITVRFSSDVCFELSAMMCISHRDGLEKRMSGGCARNWCSPLEHRTQKSDTFSPSGLLAVPGSGLPVQDHAESSPLKTHIRTVRRSDK